MATKTSFLGLVLPSLGEFFNRWNVPVNDNFKKIDDFASSFGAEIQTARGSAASLGARISASIAADGSLNDVPEVADARSSKVYGSGSGSDFQSLDERIELGDFESFYARQGLSDLTSGLAWGAGNTKHNTLISGPTNPLTASGATITLNGAAASIVANINGYRMVTNINDTITFPYPATASGTYYLYLQRQPTGRAIYTFTPSTVIGTDQTTNGAVGNKGSTNKLSVFTVQDNLVTAGIKPGDILEITAPTGSGNVGRYVVSETATENPTDLTNQSVSIIGEFSTTGTGFTATFYRMTLPTFNYTVTADSKLWSEATDKIYIGRCTYNKGSSAGTSTVISVTTYPYMAKYEGWQSVTLLGGDFSYTVAHNLGYIPKKVFIFASQANDFSQPLEPLTIGKITSGSVSISSGSQAITYTPPALRRSVIVSFTDTVINIKNATNGIFYEDFNGISQTSGYLYIVVER